MGNGLAPREGAVERRSVGGRISARTCDTRCARTRRATQSRPATGVRADGDHDGGGLVAAAGLRLRALRPLDATRIRRLMLTRHLGATVAISQVQDTPTVPGVRETSPPSAYADDLEWERSAIIVGDSAASAGRLPSSHAGAGAEERRHARWLRHQRELARAGALRRWRAEWLDLHLPGWQRPLDRRWRAQAVGVASYRVEHGRLPSMNATDGDVRRLGNWLHAQRRLRRAGELESLRGMWLDLNLPGWDDPTSEAWYSNAKACALRATAEGRLPSGTTDTADEQRLAGWLRSQRSAARNDRLAPERLDWLDEAIPGWDQPAVFAWLVTARELVAFRTTELRLPRARATGDPAERRLGGWLARQRSQHAAGRLPELRAGWLNEHLSCWQERVSDQWSSHLDATIAFAAAGGRLPARSATADAEERALATWLGNQRATGHSGRLSAERRRQLDAVLPGWASVRSARWSTAAEALARFHATHGRLPGLAEVGSDACRLAAWLGRQRTAASAGALPADRERWLRLHVPGWRTPHLSSWLMTAERVAQFRGEQGHLPTRRNSAPPLERELGVWLNNQRTAARSARLAPERARWLDEQLTGWDDPRFAAWTVRAFVVVEYRGATGCLPHGRANDELARRLGSWLETQRSVRRAGGLDARRLDWLDRHLPGWLSAETVGERMSERTARTSADGPRSLGRRDIASPEATLDEWLGRLALRGRERLHDDQLRWLDANLPGWDQRSA